MNYLDVRFLSQDIAKRFESLQRTCEVNTKLTNEKRVVLIMTEFSASDLCEIKPIASRHNVLIADWAVTTPLRGGVTLVVTLPVLEVQRNGHTY